MNPNPLSRILVHPAVRAECGADRTPPRPAPDDHPEDLIFRIHAHAARIGITGPAPLICPDAKF